MKDLLYLEKVYMERIEKIVKEYFIQTLVKLTYKYCYTLYR